MTPEISTALTLLVIGMVTVFLVLLLVVATGNVLIAIVNRFVGEEESKTGGSSSAIAPSKLAAITAAVEAFTEGKGHITKIQKA